MRLENQTRHLYVGPRTGLPRKVNDSEGGWESLPELLIPRSDDPSRGAMYTIPASEHDLLYRPPVVEDDRGSPQLQGPIRLLSQVDAQSIGQCLPEVAWNVYGAHFVPTLFGNSFPPLHLVLQNLDLLGVEDGNLGHAFDHL